MNRLAFTLLVCLVCFGCQPKSKKYWFSPDRTLEQVTADCSECNRQAQAHAQEQHLMRYRDSVEQDKPWQMDNEPIEEANRQLDEENRFVNCMAGKGYRQVRAFPLSAEIRTRNRFGGDTVQHLAGR